VTTHPRATAGPPGAPLRAGSVTREAALMIRAGFRQLALVALALVAPLAALDALVRGWIADADPDVIPSALRVLPMLSSVSFMVGLVMFAGFVDKAAEAYRLGDGFPSPASVLRALPQRRLIAADVLLAVAVALGTELLVVPGIVALLFFCLIGPIIVTENRTVLGAFRRSAALVRTRPWLVLWLVVVPVSLEVGIVHSIDPYVWSRPLLAALLINAVLAVVVTIPVAAVEVVLAHELAHRTPGG
jgi:hypothetical protein